MRTSLSSCFMGAFVLLNLLQCFSAQSYSAADNHKKIVRREITSTRTPEADATSPLTKIDPKQTTSPLPQQPVPDQTSPNIATNAAAGSAAGSGAGSGFPFFQPFQPFPPFQPFAPLPYYGYPMYQPFPFFDYSTFNSQLQNWLKQSEQQAQQAAAAGPPSNFYFGSAQGTYGPEGGVGQTFVYPPSKDGESLTFKKFIPPPPGTNQFGVSSFSSSSFSDVNGDKKGTRFSQVSVNDNGNITTVVSSDPKSAPIQLGNIPPPPVFDNNLPFANNFYRV